VSVGRNLADRTAVFDAVLRRPTEGAVSGQELLADIDVHVLPVSRCRHKWTMTQASIVMCGSLQW
jgi:DNA primase catalytic subunit